MGSEIKQIDRKVRMLAGEIPRSSAAGDCRGLWWEQRQERETGWRIRLKTMSLGLMPTTWVQARSWGSLDEFWVDILQMGS